MALTESVQTQAVTSTTALSACNPLMWGRRNLLPEKCRIADYAAAADALLRQNSCLMTLAASTNWKHTPQPRMFNMQ